MERKDAEFQNVSVRMFKKSLVYSNKKKLISIYHDIFLFKIFMFKYLMKPLMQLDLQARGAQREECCGRERARPLLRRRRGGGTPPTHGHSIPIPFPLTIAGGEPARQC
jgi:hypothetical protein